MILFFGYVASLADELIQERRKEVRREGVEVKSIR